MTLAPPQQGDAIGPVTLEGRFVSLEPLRTDHVLLLLLAAREQRDTYDWTWVPDDEASMAAYVRTALDWQEQLDAVPFATFDRETGRVLGSTRFAKFEHQPWPEGSPHQRGLQYRMVWRSAGPGWLR